jgi:iron-sulfur cluster assembly protein
MAGDVTMSERAAAKIRELLAETKQGRALRIRVVEGGCSGLEYRLDIDTPQAGDQVFEEDGARVLLDSKSILHLKGTELDYKSERMQSSFVFNNPNVKQTCGCGTSFTT